MFFNKQIKKVKRFGFTILNIIISSLLISIIFISCKKEPDKIGLDIQPPEDKLKVVLSDTSSLITYSVMEDSVKTDKLSTNLLGSIYDPVFGKSVASFATQLRMSKAGIDFGSNPQVDSLMLSLVYGGYYGDLLTQQTLHVYELAEDIFFDSVYYSNKRVQHTDIDLAHHTFYPRPLDSLTINGITIAPQLRIDLSVISPVLADKILNTPEDILSDNDKFVEYFKGLYFETDAVNYGGAVLYLNIISATSSLKLYYSNDSVDAQVFELLINENCARFNQYNHFNYDFADQTFRKQIIFQDTALGDDLIYLQAMGGIKSMIRFPHLTNFTQQSKLAVNEAVLYIPNNFSDSEFDAPPNLYLLRLNEDGGMVFLTDYFEGTDYFGGTYDKNNSSYKFRITRFIQSVFNGEYEDPQLSLSISGASSIANRIVLSGPESLNKKMKLSIVYTQLN